MNAFFLAVSYLRFHWARSLVLVLAVALILAVPVASRALLNAGEAALTARAETTPYLVGRRASALDLTMAALYFGKERPPTLPAAEVDRIWDSGLAVPIPLHIGFETGGQPIVGTTLDYFEFRDLALASGRGLAVLGEAVLGARAAEALGVAPGDTVVSTPQNLFDLDGVYPLEMPVVGVLAPTGTPDDEAVFVDIKTTWVIEGIGHGHADVVSAEALAAGETVLAGAEIVQFQRITPENIESFHFHGNEGDYPVTAVIAVPSDLRAGTILQGRYLDPEGSAQLVSPVLVVEGLVERIFRIRTVLDAVAAIVAAAALAAIGLSLFLSYRLRAAEFATARKLGAARGTALRLLAAETAVLLLPCILLAGALAFAVHRRADALVGWMLALGA
jgi:putative ABC transport system permease protein